MITERPFARQDTLAVAAGCFRVVPRRRRKGVGRIPVLRPTTPAGAAVDDPVVTYHRVLPQNATWLMESDAQLGHVFFAAAIACAGSDHTTLQIICPSSVAASLHILWDMLDVENKSLTHHTTVCEIRSILRWFADADPQDTLVPPPRRQRRPSTPLFRQGRSHPRLLDPDTTTHTLVLQPNPLLRTDHPPPHTTLPVQPRPAVDGGTALHAPSRPATPLPHPTLQAVDGNITPDANTAAPSASVTETPRPTTMQPPLAVDVSTVPLHPEAFGTSSNQIPNTPPSTQSLPHFLDTMQAIDAAKNLIEEHGQPRSGGWISMLTRRNYGRTDASDELKQAMIRVECMVRGIQARTDLTDDQMDELRESVVGLYADTRLQSNRMCVDGIDDVIERLQTLSGYTGDDQTWFKNKKRTAVAVEWKLLSSRELNRQLNSYMTAIPDFLANHNAWDERDRERLLSGMVSVRDKVRHYTRDAFRASTLRAAAHETIARLDKLLRRAAQYPLIVQMHSTLTEIQDIVSRGAHVTRGDGMRSGNEVSVA